MPQISEQEFEEIFQRNKTVMSSAISRAVQDAGAGAYGSRDVFVAFRLCF